MSRSLTNGRWFRLDTEAHHKNLKGYGHPTDRPFGRFARVQIGTWAGPGWYLLMQYSQRCPRNCCDDDVNNVYTAAEVARDAVDDIRELADRLREARQKSKESE